MAMNASVGTATYPAIAAEGGCGGGGGGTPGPTDPGNIPATADVTRVVGMSGSHIPGSG